MNQPSLHEGLREFILTWWECSGLWFWHKPTELGHSFFYSFFYFLFCSCVCFCLCGLFNCIPFYKFSRQFSAFSLCSYCLISVSLMLATIYLFMKVSFSLNVITCGWLGLKRHLTNQLTQSIMHEGHIGEKCKSQKYKKKHGLFGL